MYRYQCRVFDASVASRAMSQMKPESSRATATMATLCGLNRAGILGGSIT